MGKQKAEIVSKNLFEWAKAQFNLHSNPKEMVVTVPQYDENDNLVNMKIDNFARLKGRLFALLTNLQGVLVGRTFFKSHSFEARRVTNQGGTTLKSDSIFMTHAGEQNTLNSVIATLLKYRWKKTNIKDVTNEDNVTSADGEVIFAPNVQDGKRTYGQMYFFSIVRALFPGRLDVMGYVTSKLYFLVKAKSPRVWLRTAANKSAGIFYVPNVDSGHAVDRAVVVAQYRKGGSGWETYLKLFSGKGQINGRDIQMKERVVAPSGHYTARADDIVLVNNSSTRYTIKLPSAPNNGDKVTVRAKNYSSYIAYINGNGKKIEGSAGNKYVRYRESYTFVYYGQWYIIAKSN